MGKVTTRQMKAYIERQAEKRLESAIGYMTADIIRDFVKEEQETRMRALAEEIIKAYDRNDKWFIYAVKEQDITVRENLYSMRANHFSLTFPREEEYKKAIARIKKDPKVRPLCGGEITPELIDKIKGALS